MTELHDDLAEPTVASVFAMFSTVMNLAVRARKIPASPCQGIRVTSGEYEADRQVATPVQFMRAALRLNDSFGYSGFVLALMDAYTGARWSELVGLQPHEYDEVNRAIRVVEPLAEAKGQLVKAKRPKSPASKRWVQLPPFLADLYEGVLEDCDRAFVFVGEKGGLYGAATSGSASGALPGTVSRRTGRRGATSRRSCPASPSTKGGTPIARGSPTTESPRSVALRDSGTRCVAWAASTST
ncbi:MAG: hypothetical protein ACRDP6_03350 [Actinoallomurus sp.]